MSDNYGKGVVIVDRDIVYVGARSTRFVKHVVKQTPIQELNSLNLNPDFVRSTATQHLLIQSSSIYSSPIEGCVNHKMNQFRIVVQSI